MKKREKNKVALITGASNGLGYELTKKFAKEGYLVFAVARRKNRLKELIKDCSSQSVFPLVADISDKSSRERLVRGVLSKVKQIDIIINNAGFGKVVKFEEMSFEDVEKMINVNCLALVHLTRLVLPIMIERKSGKIINISSTGGETTLKNMAVYGATKHFVNGFTKNLHRELRGTGVSGCAFMPGAMRTGFSLVASGKLGDGGESAEKVASAIYNKMEIDRPLVFPTLYSFLTVLFNRIMTFFNLR